MAYMKYTHTPIQLGFDWGQPSPPPGAETVYCFGGGCSWVVESPRVINFVDIFPPKEVTCLVNCGGVWPPIDPPNPVPVPAAIWLFTSALVGMVVVARRKRGS